MVVRPPLKSFTTLPIRRASLNALPVAEIGNETVNWIVYYNSSSYLYSGTWVFSNNAQTSNKWNTSGSGFSADDGIWGAQNGRLDGNSPGPYLNSSGWGHQNANSGDGVCSNYYYNGTSSTIKNQKNYPMYFR